MKSYCLFCKTGSEKHIAHQLNTKDNRITAIAPVRILQEKRKSRWQQREQILIPGYVFIYTEDEIRFEPITEIPALYKILEYETGLRELQGRDHEYSIWIYRHQGSIATSKVLTEGSNVKVIDGPLLDCLGTIIKLDKHKRRVWVAFEFDGQSRVISLSAECIAAEDHRVKASR